MNIIYIFEFAPDPQRGGASRLTNSLIKYWNSNSPDKNFYCAYFYKEKDYISIFNGDIQLNLDNPNTLRNYLTNKKISIIINQMGYSKEICTYICNAKDGLNIPLITVYHSMPGWEYIFMKNNLKTTTSIKEGIKYYFIGIYKYYYNWQIRQRNRLIFSKSDRLIVLSKSYIKQYTKLNKIKKEKEKILSISNPLSFQEININLSNKKNRVLIVGRFSEEEKRFLLILKIWKRFEQEYPNSEWLLTFIGFGKDEYKYRTYIQENNLKKVELKGKQDPLPFYKESSIFMMTSAFEGFGLTLTEAQQCGTVPIVMNSFPTVHDIIIDGYNGIICPNNDINTMYNKMIFLIKNKKERERLAENGIKSVKKFSLQNISKEWDELFNKLI